MRMIDWRELPLFSRNSHSLAEQFGSERSNPPPPPQSAATFSNPLLIQIAAGGTVQDCPDPSIIRDNNSAIHPGILLHDGPLNDADKDASGNFNFHLITMHKTSDLVH